MTQTSKPLDFSTTLQVTYTNATQVGMTTDHILWRYRSEYHPDATVQNPAKMYGGALRACALAALKPRLFMMVGRVKERPYTAMQRQNCDQEAIQTCQDWYKPNLNLCSPFQPTIHHAS